MSVFIVRMVSVATISREGRSNHPVHVYKAQELSDPALVNRNTDVVCQTVEDAKKLAFDSNQQLIEFAECEKKFFLEYLDHMNRFLQVQKSEYGL